MFKLHMLQNIRLLFIQKLNITTLETVATPKVAHTKLELCQSLMMLQPNSPENSRVLKISVLGCPNSGKSSLVNMLTRWKLCAVSGKINTTRSKQTVVLTQDNVQLAFIDLPGVIGRKKGLNFKMEKSLIRDPHVGIFESDLIICVIDATHKGSQTELHAELLKSLYFFRDKPAILVLNKIDRVTKKIMLLDMTKKLTDGIVGGKISHKDRYANRFKRDVPKFTELIGDNRMKVLLEKHRPPAQLESSDDEIAEVTISECNEKEETKEILKNDVKDFKLRNAIEGHVGNYEDIVNIDEAVSGDDNKYDILSEIIENDALTDDLTEKNDYQSVDVMETNDGQSRRSELVSELKEVMKILYPAEFESMLETNDMEHDDQILDILKSHLMLKTASKEEIRTRREKWQQISRTLEETRETCWKGFDDVFAVSSVTGAGIDVLREYLIKKAKRGPWCFHSSLVTDREPETLVKMTIMATCLNLLEKEIPYRLKIIVKNYQISDDGSIHALVIINCKTSRELMAVIGTKGKNISVIADQSRELLESCFQAPVSLKVEAHRSGIAPEHLKRMRAAKDFKDLYPKVNGP